MWDSWRCRFFFKIMLHTYTFYFEMRISTKQFHNSSLLLCRAVFKSINVLDWCYEKCLCHVWFILRSFEIKNDWMLYVRSHYRSVNKYVLSCTHCSGARCLIPGGIWDISELYISSQFIVTASISIFLFYFIFLLLKF